LKKGGKTGQKTERMAKGTKKGVKKGLKKGYYPSPRTWTLKKEESILFDPRIVSQR
jgi:hypothetical protein